MTTEPKTKGRTVGLLAVFFIAGALVTAGVLALLLNIFERRSEADVSFQRVVEIDDTVVDAAVWGQNFPIQYESFRRTAEMPEEEKVARTPTAEDPREFTAASKLEADPRLVTMWQGYAFAIDYREPRGHEWMLEDQRLTRRVLERDQPGACLNCHASTVALMNELGDGDAMAGWAVMNKMPYNEATQLVEHPVQCLDCHDPATMELRITRPAFIEGIKEYMAGQGVADYDVNEDATALEMRTFVCAQCHVEYYFAGEGKTLTFPWDHGLTIDNALQYYDEEGWTDFEHALTGAQAVKAQHPDFETFAQGVHYQAGVTCADCHMSYTREGAMKVSNHQVASPMRSDETINSSCLTCHRTTADAMRERVEGIHDRYEHAKDVSFDALIALIEDIEAASASANTPEPQLALARDYQRKAQFFLDYVVSENSRGFHAPAYTIRVLNDVTDAARRGQLALLGLETEPYTLIGVGDADGGSGS
ncbi:MAG: ammonia-forming cytochrome c nitrite reductase subunit c552 [Actinomycetales bacterium]|jgi:respiratory nitrite reductase (cytochrome; ammonia-forming) precursor (EC 1.7.2.2)|nr:ammonia-forming cytochrome c nitrite reductase subunit c552 [Actinomycetales bacterium]